MNRDAPPPLRAGMGAIDKAAMLAESVAATFERVADTYRQMADTGRSPDDNARLLAHAARLENLAAKEHAAARHFPPTVGSSGVVEDRSFP